MNLTIIGTGYVGLVAGACFAETGNHVTCVDVNEQRITDLNNGIIPIYEPNLDELVARNHKKGRLSFTTNTAEAVQTATIIFFAVPTPSGEDGSADLQYVLDAAATVAKAMNGYKILVNKSTVPVGTARKVKEVVASLTKHPFDVVSNPEFLKEGAAIEDFLKPDRVVLGCDSETAKSIMLDLYSPFSRIGKPLLVMSIESAELTKYAANAMLATRISFMNEIARLCEKVGADVNEVRLGIGSDNRIGKQFLYPGVGFGGSCFPKDLRAIYYTDKQNDLELQMVRATIDANEIQKHYLAEKVFNRMGRELKGKRFALWGLAFKANTDDIRESPALVIMEALLAQGAEVRCYDPEAMPNTKAVFGDRAIFCEDQYDTLIDADALVIATEWHEFRQPDFDKVKGLMRGRLLFDGRNLYNPKTMLDLGFEYSGIGQGVG